MTTLKEEEANHYFIDYTNLETISITKTIFLLQIWILLYVSSSVAHCQFPALRKLQLPLRVVGPESVAFDKKGDGPYTGVADGRIIKYQGPKLGFTDFAITSPNRTNKRCDGTNDLKSQRICGNPLGLEFYDKTGDLYTVDAYYGLLVVGPTRDDFGQKLGGLATQLVTSFEGTRVGFLDALNIDQKTGVIYFVDAGAIFRIGDRTTIAESGDTSGRLFKYDIATKQVTLLLRGLSGPVGLSLSKDSSYVLITEYIAQRTRRFWLKGPKANSSDVFRKVEGIPDNIRTALGDFGVAIANTKQNTTYSIGQRINQLGKIVETRNFTAQYNDTPLGLTLVQEYKGKLYIGSLDQNFIGVYRAFVQNVIGVYTV
ncbi:protein STRICTOSIDINE SYNTHASE-LIKE 11-like [Solanum dulcamara]|uniref:protein STRICTOSIDINE SYNTHASE-LIKE 11-like n=1 Tax=Solanum dulcamara TaxID=45834 RepID=UPI0024868219|nr:protein STRICTOSIDINE SYNTHASE-LIKE 11-like [Solanum dulcamara]